ncbi:murein hydrolase activator EnvC family protein [Sphingomonas sp. DT-204]|uniref:murein hydrolase activator EnvC family protein n=1 Tax=Sphingomonas sp. DT-204 TaxID=3396166 RepID=UPI003F192DC3
MRRLALLPLALVAAAPAPPDRRAELKAANAEAAAAEARSRAFERAAAAERDEAARARAQEAAVAERIKAAEAKIVAARARVTLVDGLIAEQRERLAERQAPIERLVAALQSLARRPAAVALVQPGSMSDIVHVRAVLGTMVPVVRQRTAAVRAEIARSRKLRANAALAAATLRDGHASLRSERLALVRMEGAHRLRSRDLDRSAMFESDRAIALGERARDLIDQIEESGTAVETGAALAALPGPLPRPAKAGESPAPARFTVPPYRLPAAGRVVEGLGELSSAGVRSRGLTLAVASGGAVVAPAAGQVLFARRFRDYGTVVIIDHGNGWTSAITGLAAAAVKRGDRVAQGAPLGRAPAGDARISVELRRRGTPVDLAQLIS